MKEKYIEKGDKEDKKSQTNRKKYLKQWQSMKKRKKHARTTINNWKKQCVKRKKNNRIKYDQKINTK